MMGSRGGLTIRHRCGAGPTPKAEAAADAGPAAPY
jgi:hypothetical protein